MLAESDLAYLARHRQPDGRQRARTTAAARSQRRLHRRFGAVRLPRARHDGRHRAHRHRRQRRGPARPAGGLLATCGRRSSRPTGPTVIVMKDASGTPNRVAYAGEIMVTLARRLGAIGMVTDGALRDVAEVRAKGFHYFMRYPVVSHANFELSKVGDPVSHRRPARPHRRHPARRCERHRRSCPGERPSPTSARRSRRSRSAERRDLDYLEGPEFTLDGYRRMRGYGS